MEPGARNAMYEHPLRARRPVCEADLQSPSARVETQWMLELRTSHLDNEQNVASNEREIITRLGHDTHSALRYHRHHMVTENQQLVREGDAQNIVLAAPSGLRPMPAEMTSLRSHPRPRQHSRIFSIRP